MKFIKLHQYGDAILVNLSNISEVYMAPKNESLLYLNFAADDGQLKITVDESIDEILELIKQVSE